MRPMQSVRERGSQGPTPPPWNVDDVTRGMSKVVLVNVQEWGCFSIFWRADDVTRTMREKDILNNIINNFFFHFPDFSFS